MQPEHLLGLELVHRERARRARDDPVYGMPSSSSIPWTQPSSPPRPCSARKATSIVGLSHQLVDSARLRPEHDAHDVVPLSTRAPRPRRRPSEARPRAPRSFRPSEPRRASSPCCITLRHGTRRLQDSRHRLREWPRDRREPGDHSAVERVAPGDFACPSLPRYRVSVRIKRGPQPSTFRTREAAARHGRAQSISTSTAVMLSLPPRSFASSMKRLHRCAAASSCGDGGDVVLAQVAVQPVAAEQEPVARLQAE